MTDGIANLITSGAYVDVELAAEFGRVPPAFLPAGHRRLYQYGVEQLAALGGRTFISLPEDFDIPAWDAGRFAAADVEVVRVPAGLPLGSSIRLALEQISVGGSLRILHGDTLFLSDLPDDLDAVSLSNSTDGYTWGYRDVEGRFSAAPVELASDDAQVLTGFFTFSDVQTWCEALTAADGDFIEALNLYTGVRSLEGRVVQPWLDFGHLQPFYRSRALVTTQRAFNSLEMTARHVEKWSDVPRKIEAEIAWYVDLPAALRLYTPAYLGRTCRPDGACAYRTAFEHAPTLHELFVFGRLSERVWRRIFESCFEVLDAFSAFRPPGPTNSLKALTMEKTADRLDAWARGQPSDVLHREWLHNGRRLPNLSRIAEEATGLIDQETDDCASLMHGDLNFGNIFYRFRSEQVVLVDPRGEVEPGKPTLFGDNRYDLAKLHHSLEGYDLILAGMHTLRCYGPYDLSLEFPQDASRESARAVAQEFTLAGRRIGDPENTALAVHLFLSMLPLHADRPDRQVAFLANALRLFASLETTA